MEDNKAEAASLVGQTVGFVRTIATALVLAYILRSLVFSPYSIPSESMVPNLLVGDYVYVPMYSYGYSGASIGTQFIGGYVPEGRVWSAMPERGDVVVFKLPVDNRTDYIKRVIGLPGDRVQIVGGRLLINGEVVPRERIDDFVWVDPNGIQQAAPQYIETLPGGGTHTIIELRGDRGSLDNTPAFDVPEGHYFMLGDNRDNSGDSRLMRGVGFVPFENLIGRADVILVSMARGAWPIAFWRWPSDLRTERLFTWIE